MEDNPGAPPVVLVVEDEALIRMGAADQLERSGYEVLEAGERDRGSCDPEGPP